jgi:N-methylhydantoinase B
MIGAAQRSDIFVDYADTPPQIERGIDCVMNYTHAYALFAAKCPTNPLIPHNEGGFRPVPVSAPGGCVLNPKYPAAVGPRAQMGPEADEARTRQLRGWRG